MKFDKNNCLGGRINNREVVGIRYKGCTIFPMFEPEELYNEYEMSYYNSGYTSFTLRAERRDCYAESDIETDWGDQSTSNSLTHTYSSNFTGQRTHIIKSSCFVNLDYPSYSLDEAPEGYCSYIKAVKHIRPDIIDGSGLFSYFTGIGNNGDLYLPNTSFMTQMQRMFRYCRNIESLDLSSFKTGNVTNMEGMFENCKRLQDLNLSNFNMENVTYTDYMLYHCDELRTLRLDNCSNSTINKIINSLYFPVGTIEGMSRKIYVNPNNIGDLTPPDNWVFVNCETNEVIN